MQVPMYGQPAAWAFLQQRQMHAAAAMQHRMQPRPFPGGAAVMPGDAYQHAILAAPANGHHPGPGGLHVQQSYAGGHPLHYGNGMMQ